MKTAVRLNCIVKYLAVRSGCISAITLAPQDPNSINKSLWSRDTDFEMTQCNQSKPIGSGDEAKPQRVRAQPSVSLSFSQFPTAHHEESEVLKPTELLYLTTVFRRKDTLETFTWLVSQSPIHRETISNRGDSRLSSCPTPSPSIARQYQTGVTVDYRAVLPLAHPSRDNIKRGDSRLSSCPTPSPSIARQYQTGVTVDYRAALPLAHPSRDNIKPG
ncbi:hypothetical protein RRG08_053204 [Elysia crispata]|uniref:Uncharacterized protein n=1 Tax=Elysia crispata TaxID=231223 RepID=A0AAE1EAJ2_9GAST|nr:hypothetical protein RRG08_053204 [Elysia crispata]